MSDRTSTVGSRPVIVAVVVGALAVIAFLFVRPSDTPMHTAPAVAAAASSLPSATPSSSPAPSVPPASTIPSPSPSSGSTSSVDATGTNSSVVRSCDGTILGITADEHAGQPWDVGKARAGAPVRNGKLAGFLGVGQGFEPTGRGRLVTLDPRTGALTTATRFDKDASGLPTAVWSPTGTAIAITSGTGSGFGRCSTIDVVTGHRLTHVFAGRGFADATWAPDGSTLVLLSGTYTFSAGAGTRSMTLPPCGDDCSFGELSWAPDGRHVATTRDFNDGHQDEVVVTVDSGRVQLMPRGGEIFGWLDDRTVLLMRGPRPGRNHWVGSRLDGSQRTVHLGIDASTVARLTLQPSPDLRSAAGSQCLYCPFVGLHGGVVRVLWKGGHLPIAQAWSPDSRWIAFSVRRGGPTQRGTWIVRPDGTGLRRISTRVLTSLVWGPAPR